MTKRISNGIITKNSIEFTEKIYKKMIFTAFEAGFKAYRHNIAESKYPYDIAAKIACEIQFKL